MQGAIEMGFSLPNTENFPAFFENIKFGHQNMLLKVESNPRVRGYCKKLVKCFARLDIRKFSFSHRVVNEWNSLPEWVVNSTSVHCFKVNIDKFFHDCGIESYSGMASAPKFKGGIPPLV